MDSNFCEMWNYRPSGSANLNREGYQPEISLDKDI
jgi:hypothetical protein